MSPLETSPADWLRNLLSTQPGVRDACFDVPPNQDRVLLTTQAGQVLSVRIAPVHDDYEWGDE